MLKYIKRLRRIGADEWTVRGIHIFLTIAEAGPDGIGMPELGERLELSSQVVGRLRTSIMYATCPELSAQAGIWPQTGLLEKYDHPTHGRIKMLKLSAAGVIAHKYLMEGE